MTPDERRLTTALRTYAGGVDVTDADLDRLEAQLDERLHPTRSREPRRRPWQLAVAACSVTALVLAGTALWRTSTDETLPAAPSVTPADLAGVWMVDEPESNGHLWHFTADGRLTASSHPDEYLALEADLERYTLGAGDALTLSDEPGCPAKVRLTPEGTMTLAGLNASADCETFPKGTDWHFIRVSPLSVAGAALTEHPNAELPHAAAEPVFMHDVKGTWLLRGSGTLLVLRNTSEDEGEYVADDDGDGPDLADERGIATLGPDGGLVLHPSEGAGQACDTVYERVVTTGITVEAELADSSCGRLGGAQSTWVRLN